MVSQSKYLRGICRRSLPSRVRLRTHIQHTGNQPDCLTDSVLRGAAGGPLGNAVGNAVGRYIGPHRSPILGRTLRQPNISYAPGKTMDAIVEGGMQNGLVKLSFAILVYASFFMFIVASCLRRSVIDPCVAA